MTNVRQLRSSHEPTVDPKLTSKLVAKFGKKLMKEGFTGVPVLVQRYYRQVPGNARYDYDYEFGQETRTWIRIEGSRRLVCEESHMTPTEYSIMADIWSYWWRGENQPFPAISDIAAHVGKSVRQVKRYLFRMQESGWMLSISQYNVEGKQISNRYDFTPFLRKLVDYLESVGVLEKRDEVTSEGVIFTPERGSEVWRVRGSVATPKTNIFEEDSSDIDESMIRDGADRAELEKGRDLPNHAPAYSRIEHETIGNEEGTNSSNINNNEGNEHSNNENNTRNNCLARAKDVNIGKSCNKTSRLEKMAAALGVAWEAVQQMEDWLKTCPRPETVPTLQAGPDLVPLGGLMTGWSRQLGDSAHCKSNVTQVTKICQFATEHGLIDEEFVSCLSQTYGVTQKRYKKGELDAPLAFFFRTLKLDVLATLAECGEREIPPPSPVVEPNVPEEAEPQVLAAGEEESSRAERAAPCAQVAAEAEQVEVLVTDDPAVGFSGQDITFWWADRLLDGLDPTRRLYRYQVYPTNAGRWGFVVYSKEHKEDTWIFLSHHEVDEALHPASERSQD